MAVVAARLPSSWGMSPSLRIINYKRSCQDKGKRVALTQEYGSVPNVCIRPAAPPPGGDSVSQDPGDNVMGCDRRSRREAQPRSLKCLKTPLDIIIFCCLPILISNQ